MCQIQLYLFLSFDFTGIHKNLIWGMSKIVVGKKHINYNYFFGGIDFLFLILVIYIQ